MIKFISLGLPKCGSLSLTEAFQAAGIPAVHWRTPADSFGQPGKYVAELMSLQMVRSRPVFSHGLLSEYEAITQMDAHINRTWLGWFPQVDIPELICRQYPDAKFLLPTRPIEDHLDSIANWNQGDYRERLRNFGITNLWALITDHYQRVRRIFAGAPNFYEFDITRANDSELSAFIGTAVHFPHLNQDRHAQTHAEG